MSVKGMLRHLARCFAVLVRTLMSEVWLLFLTSYVPHRKQREKELKVLNSIYFCSIKMLKSAKKCFCRINHFIMYLQRQSTWTIQKRMLKKLEYQFFTILRVFAECSTKFLTLAKWNEGGKVFLGVNFLFFFPWYLFSAKVVQFILETNAETDRSGKNLSSIEYNVSLL